MTPTGAGTIALESSSFCLLLILTVSCGLFPGFFTLVQLRSKFCIGCLTTARMGLISIVVTVCHRDSSFDKLSGSFPEVTF
jgi:hypothetical protein